MTNTCQTCKWIIHHVRQYFGVNVANIDDYLCNRHPHQEVVELCRPACGEFEPKEEEKPGGML